MLQLHPLPLPQNEERDSSDEEWERAYEAMDPSAQLGWGTPQNEVGDGTARLVRDVFAAGDMVHEAALMEVGVDNNNEAEHRGCMPETGGDVSVVVAENPGGSEEGYVEGTGPRGCVPGLLRRAWQGH